VKDLDNDATGRVTYDILATFQHTEIWALQPKTLPFGFIVQRTPVANPPQVFVVFRGTREDAEWVDDFDHDQVPFMGNDNLGKVSDGFNKIYTGIHNPQNIPSIQKTVLQTLQSCPPNAQIFITGHSLGSSLATLAALHITTATAFKPTLCTFASPRVGNSKFAALFQNIVAYRIANSEDIVPTLPPAATQLTGEDMGIKPIRQTIKRSLDQLTKLFPGAAVFDQEYTHVGTPLYFTRQMGSVSYNHNMSVTYREALLNLR